MISIIPNQLLEFGRMGKNGGMNPETLYQSQRWYRIRRIGLQWLVS